MSATGAGTCPLALLSHGHTSLDLDMGHSRANDQDLCCDVDTIVDTHGDLTPATIQLYHLLNVLPGLIEWIADCNIYFVKRHDFLCHNDFQ